MIENKDLARDNRQRNKAKMTSSLSGVHSGRASDQIVPSHVPLSKNDVDLRASALAGKVMALSDHGGVHEPDGLRSQIDPAVSEEVTMFRNTAKDAAREYE